MKNIINVVSEKIYEVKVSLYSNRLAKEWEKTNCQKVMEDANDLLPDFESFDEDATIEEIVAAMKPGFDEINRRAKAGIYRV